MLSTDQGRVGSLGQVSEGVLDLLLCGREWGRYVKRSLKI